MNRDAQHLRARVILLIQRERERRKLSKYFVAQESGLSPQMIAYVENGERNPTLETVLRICAALSLDLAQVLKQARSETKKKAARKK